MFTNIEQLLFILFTFIPVTQYTCLKLCSRSMYEIVQRLGVNMSTIVACLKQVEKEEGYSESDLDLNFWSNLFVRNKKWLTITSNSSYGIGEMLKSNVRLWDSMMNTETFIPTQCYTCKNVHTLSGYIILYDDDNRPIVLYVDAEEIPQSALSDDSYRDINWIVIGVFTLEDLFKREENLLKNVYNTHYKLA